MPKIALLFISIFILSACSLKSIPAATVTPTVTVTPTISQDNSLDTIDKELQDTNIPAEDFSDL